jgi:hypothetical protein
MTKQQELAIFDEFTFKCGADSYLGPWLQSIRSEVERSITSDLYPMPDLPDAAYRKGEALRARALTEAETIVEQGNKKYAEAMAKAERDIASKRALAKRWLAKAMDEI